LPINNRGKHRWNNCHKHQHW